MAGDGQTKLNAVINGQADLLLGYVMDQSMKIKDATGKDVYPIKFADYGINMVSSGVDRQHRLTSRPTPIWSSASCRRRPRRSKPPRRTPKGAAQSILDANPKGGKIDTLTQGFELTIPLYRTPETKGKRPFQVTDQNMTDTVNLLVEYGGPRCQGQGKSEGVLYQRLSAEGRSREVTWTDSSFASERKRRSNPPLARGALGYVASLSQ